MKTTPQIPFSNRAIGRARVTVALTFTVLSAVLLGGISVQAATYNWTSANSDGYTNQTYWSPAPTNVNGLPAINDTAIVGNGTQANGSVVYTNLPPDPASTNNLSLLEMGTAAGTSSFNMTGGVLLITNGTAGVAGSGGTAFSLGDTGGAIDTFTQSGGTLVVARPSTSLYYYQDAFLIPDGSSGTGTYTNSGGIAYILCGTEIGDATSSTGTFTVNGGTVIDNGWFGVGRQNSSIATFNLMAGSFYILRNPENDGTGNAGGVSLCQGTTATGTANISGGNLYCTQLRFNSSSGSTETLNVSGGSIYVGYIGAYWTGSAASQTINISGGTFHTADMLPVATPGTIGSTNTILSDGTNWSWYANLPVTLMNNTFQVNGQTGPGYVTFAPETNRTITLSNQWSGAGGMTISGPGTVAISVSNALNFSGTLNVTGGTLAVNAASALTAALVNPLTINGGTLALAAALNDTIGLTIDSGTLAILNGGSVLDRTLYFQSGSLVFSNTSAMTFTNVVTGGGNVLVVGGGTVNVGSNLQNTGTIAQTNGALVVNGTILDASSVTNSGPASVGPLVAEGTINSPIGIGPNSSLELGTTVAPGTLNASNVTLNGTWIEKINTATTVGGGVNDLLICSNLTLNPSSVLTIDPQSAPSVGSYVIAEYTGTLTGTFGTLNNGTGDGMSLSYATPGEIILNVSSVNQSSLIWAATNFSPNINWDVNTTPNWTNTVTLTQSTFHQLDTVAFNAAPGTGITNRVSVTGQVIPSSITISGGLPYLFSGTGYISGDTGISYSDTNTSGIYTSGNNFTGPVNINDGVLQLGSGGSSWLGTANTTYVNGGTLDLNAQGVGAEPLVIQGTGSTTTGTNNGAINNSSTSSPGQSAGPLNITLAGDTTLNASGNRWDIGVATLGAGGGSFAGNGHNLTKIGNSAIWMHEVGDIGVNNITISNGLLGFEYTIDMGMPSATVTVEPGATVGFYQTVSNLSKQMVLNGSATLQSGGGTGSSNNFIGQITLNGTNAITTSSYPLNLSGNITGTGGFAYSGPGPLYLGGVDNYSGPTIIGAGGTLVLSPGNSLPDTSLIYLTPSASTVLNVNGSLNLNSGQTLEGSGDIISGVMTANPDSVISLGTNQSSAAYGTMVFTNNLTLNGNTNYLKISDNNNIGVDNDLIYVNNSLTLSGTSTLIITPLAALNSLQNYTIIESAGIASGGASNLKVISTSPRYTMTPVINGGNVQLSISGNAAPLEWEGYLTPNWDLVTSNWLNMSTSSHDHFYNGDNPTFDDTASVNAVVVTNNVLVSGMNMSNVVKNYTFSGGGVITGPLNVEGNGSGTGGTTVLAMSNAPAFTTIDSSAGTLIYNLQGLTNYLVAASITDSNGTGNSAIIFGGTNTATLTGDNVPAPNLLGSYNPDFDGAIWVTNGILQYSNVDSLGVDASVSDNPSFAPLIVTNNGTLNFNGVAAGTANGAPLGGEKWIHISGNGFNGQGALTDSGNNQEPSGAFCYLYFDTNATIHIASTRCDQHVLSGNVQQVEGNGYNLTFFGGGAFFFNAQSDGDTHLGNIDVACTNGGRLAFQGGPLALGVTTNYLTIEPGGEVTFYNFSNILDGVHLGVQKNVWLKGNASIDSAGGAGSESNNFNCPIFLSGTNLIGTRYDMHVWGSIMDSNGPGGFILGNDSVGASASALWLDGTNDYSGQTIISNETLVVGANSTLGMSTYVQVNSGAILNLSATPNYSFGSTQTNQTMAGNGAVVGPATGNLTFNAGGTLAVGLPAANGLAQTNTFTLTMNNNVVFNPGSTNYVVANKTSASPGAVPVDNVTGLTSLTLGGTLVITNYGLNFVAGDSLALFSATMIATNSTFNIVPATPGPNLVWNISTFLSTGTLQVSSSSSVNPNPTNITVHVSGGLLTLSWPTDHIGWQLQALTNAVNVGIVTNVPVGHNWANFNPSTAVDSVNIPINLTNGTVFYRLVY